jgi:SAM-dependent methyltransferase
LTLRKIVRALKKTPLDFGQYEMRYRTGGKLVAYELVCGEGKALDLGCRDGYWGKKLRQKGYTVISADIKPVCSNAIRLDANEQLPFRDEEFDLVWCCEVVEHLRDPAFAISEMKRILKPEGVLLLTTPNRRFWVYSLLEAVGINLASIQSEDHQFFFDVRDLECLIGKFEVFGFVPYFLYKRKIQKYVSGLSPTLVVKYTRPPEPACMAFVDAESHPHMAGR